MGKNKLKKFAEMETFHNVFQCGARECVEDSPVVTMRGKWRELYFHNNNPIVLELGCGRGEYTVGLAQRDPNKNYIGIDIKGARMWAGAKQAELAGIKNVAFFISGSGKVIQISSISSGEKKLLIISILVRRKATFLIPANSACLAPAHMRAPLMSMPI